MPFSMLAVKWRLSLRKNWWHKLEAVVWKLYVELLRKVGTPVTNCVVAETAVMPDDTSWRGGR